MQVKGLYLIHPLFFFTQNHLFTNYHIPSSFTSSEHTVLNKINIPDVTILSLDLPFIHHSNFFLECFGILYSLPTISTVIILAQDHYHFIPELLHFSLCFFSFFLTLFTQWEIYCPFLGFKRAWICLSDWLSRPSRSPGASGNGLQLGLLLKFKHIQTSLAN